MHFYNVAAFFVDVKHINVSVFAIRVDCFDFIHRFLLNQADVDFLEVLTEIFIRNEKDSIVTSKWYLRTVWKSLFILVFNDFIPEIFVALVTFSVPLIFAPRISEFEHSVGLMLMVLKSLCANLNWLKIYDIVALVWVESRFFPVFFLRFCSATDWVVFSGILKQELPHFVPWLFSVLDIEHFCGAAA